MPCARARHHAHVHRSLGERRAAVRGQAPLGRAPRRAGSDRPFWHRREPRKRRGAASPPGGGGRGTPARRRPSGTCSARLASPRARDASPVVAKRRRVSGHPFTGAAKSSAFGETGWGSVATDGTQGAARRSRGWGKSRTRVEGKRGNCASLLGLTSASEGVRAHLAEWHRSWKRAKENVRKNWLLER